jgi:hypothetical protein
MRTSRALGLTAVLASTALIAPGAASAARPTTYSGEFDGHIAYVGCTTDHPVPGDATGTWSVTLHGTAARGVFDITIDGTPDVAYTYPNLKQAPAGADTDLSVYGPTQAGLLTVTVRGDRMEYTIAPYGYNGVSCASVTFPGTVD